MVRIRNLLQVGCMIVGFVLYACQPASIDYNQRMCNWENNYIPVTTDTAITCMTFNIQCGFPVDLDPWTPTDIGTQNQLDRLADVIQSVNPEIVCLQEVPFNRYNSEVKVAVKYLADRLDMNFAYGTHGYNDPTGIWPVEGQWGTALLTKYHIVHADNFEIEYVDVWQRRSMLVTELLLNGEPIYVYNLHYIAGPAGGLDHTLQILNNHAGNKQIMMGDFNAIASDMPEFPVAGYNETFTLLGLPVTTIDMIYLDTTRFNVIQSDFITGSDTISDHLAIYSIVQPL
jgi:endonuclease/exonuclease/phosphatase family metal-dependent hydrolase